MIRLHHRSRVDRLVRNVSPCIRLKIAGYGLLSEGTLRRTGTKASTVTVDIVRRLPDIVH